MCTCANVGINLGTNIIKLAFNRRQNKIELEESVPHDTSDAVAMNGNGDASPTDPVKKKMTANARSSFTLNPISEVQDTAVKEKPKKPKSSVKPIYKWRSWQVGFIIFKLSNVINFVSLGFGKQSVLASLSSVQFVSNLVFCYFVLHERLGLNDIMGTVLIIAGVIICIVANSSDGSKTYTVNELISLMQNQAYLIYIGVLAALAILAYMTYNGNFYFFKLQTEDEARRKEKEREQGVKYYSGTDMSPKFSLSEGREGGELIFSHIGFIKIETLRPLCFAAYSAVIGTQVVTFAKITMLQIRLSIGGEMQFDKFLTYVFIIGMIVTGIFWDKQINVGLRKFDALVIVPVMQSFWTIFAICNGGMFFQEFNGLSTNQISIFCSGMVVMLLGMGLLMWHEEDIYEDDLELMAADEEDMKDEDDSNRITLKDSTEKRILRRTSMAASRASIVLYSDSIRSGGGSTTGAVNPLQRLSSTKSTMNPLEGEKKEEMGADDVLPAFARPAGADGKRKSMISKVSTSAPRKRLSTLGIGLGGQRRSDPNRKTVGKVRTLSMAATSAAFGVMRVPTMDLIEEE